MKQSNQRRVMATVTRTAILTMLVIPALWVGYWLAVFFPSHENGLALPTNLDGEPGTLRWDISYLNGSDDPTQERMRIYDLSRGTLEEFGDLISYANVPPRVTPGYAFTLPNLKQIYIKSLQSPDRNVVRTWTVHKLDENGRRSSYEIELPGFPKVVFKNKAWTTSGNKLIVVDLDRPEEPFAELELVAKDRLIFPVSNPNRLIVISDYMSNTGVVDLFEMDHPSLRKIVSYSKSTYRGIHSIRGKHYAMLVNARGQQEIHWVDDDSIVPIDFDPTIDLTVSTWGLAANVSAIWVKQPTDPNLRYFDFGTWRALPGTPDPQCGVLSIRDEANKRLFYSSADANRIVCVHEQSGETLWKRENLFPNAQGPLTLHAYQTDKIILNGNFIHPEALILDQATGNTLQVVQPLWAINYVAFMWSMIMASLAWIWLAWSARNGGWAWWDCCTLLVFAVGLLCVRVQLSGDSQAAFRLEYRIMQGSCAGGMMLATMWLFYGKTRWTYRMLPLILGLASIVAMMVCLFGVKSWMIGETLVGILVLWIWMVVVCWIFKTAGVCLTQVNVSDASANASLQADRFKIPLRDIFVVTSAIAVLFATLRYSQLPQSSVMSRGFMEGNVYSLLVAINAWCTSWCALSVRSLWLRWSVLLLLGFTLPAAGLAFQAWSYNSSNYGWMAKTHFGIHIASLITIFLLLHAFRWRGWRLVRSAKAK